MNIQRDDKVRVVALENLHAMCIHVSGMCHRFEVISVTPNYCHVAYSNPDEYGTEDRITAMYPVYSNTWPTSTDNPYIVLEIHNVINDKDGEGWQYFQILEECEKLWRDPADQQWHVDNGKLKFNIDG